jgi:hypothetical protein
MAHACRLGAAAVNWVIANQLGRRNLTPEQKSYLRGKRYQVEKKAKGRPDGKLPQNEGETAERLATEYGVSPATIARDAEFAEATDTLEDEVRPELTEGALSELGRVYPVKSSGSELTSRFSPDRSGNCCRSRSPMPDADHK